jgi:hypothetical protein
MLLTRPPWLDIPWQETKKTFPELVEGNIQKKDYLLKKSGSPLKILFK